MPKGGRGGKSGLHGQTVPDNVRRGRPQGKCHREQTATARCVLAAVRVKRCGKSAPRCRQRKRHGKPHREQNRIGTAREQSRIGSGSAVRVGCSKRRATGVPEEWPSRVRLAPQAIQNPAYRPADTGRGSAAQPPGPRQFFHSCRAAIASIKCFCWHDPRAASSFGSLA